jgi:ribulose-5-phosphate 4-epimerase/fuculose-1-phosphate aldolase
MSMTQVAALREVRESDAASERDVRVQLAACYRLVAHFGMDDLVYTHISARVPGHPDQFLINPYGLMFHEITASSLVKVDLEGRVLEETPYPVNIAGIVIHSALLAGRADIGCALHTHTRAGVAVSCLEEGLLPINQWALMFYDRLAYHDYEGIALDFDECERLQQDLGQQDAMILRNHGLLTVGRTVPEAFSYMYYLEQSCRAQIDMLAMGRKLHELPPAVCEHTAQQYAKLPEPRGGREWPSLLGILDAKDPSYRD